MKIGRNDPCHCGSGKKYKKCCLKKDEAIRAEERTVNKPKPTTALKPVDEPPAEPKIPESPPDPLVEKQNAFFDEFQSRDYEGRIELFLSSIDEPGLLDGDNAFEMIDDIYPETVKRGEYARFNDLVDTLRSRLPDVYANSEVYYLDWYICNTLVLDQLDVLAKKVRELVQAPGNIDVFYWMLDRLSYHGHLQLLIEAMRINKSGEQTSEDIMSYGMDEFTEMAVNFEIFDYLEHHSDPDPNNPDLRGRLEYFIKDLRMDILTEAIKHLSGYAGRCWSQEDFRNLKSETSRRDLQYLSRDFLGELSREKRINITRGELGRVELVCYLLKRIDGELEPRQSMFEAMMGQGKRRKPKPKPKQSHPRHILCPDRETFDRYLADLLNFMNPQIYKVMALFELVPDWLEFLESRSLIDEEFHKQVLSDLRPLRETMEKIVNKHFSDPAQRPTIKEF